MRFLKKLSSEEIALYLFTLYFFIYWLAPKTSESSELKIYFIYAGVILLALFTFVIFYLRRIRSLKTFIDVFKFDKTFDKIMLLWVAYSFISLILSVIWKNDIVYTLFDFYLSTNIVVVYFLASAALSSKEKINNFLEYFMLAGLITSLLKIFSVYVLHFDSYKIYGGSLFKTESFFLVFLFLFSLLFYLNSNLNKKRYFAYSSLFLFAIIIGMSRTVLVCSGVSLVPAFLFAKEKKSFILRLLPVLLVASILSFAFFLSIGSTIDFTKILKMRYVTTVDMGHRSISQRVNEDIAVVLQSKDSFILGKGFGAEYQTFNQKTQSNTKHFIDSNLFHLYYQQGILGLVIFFSLFAVYFKESYRYILKTKDRKAAIIIIASSLCIFATIVASLVINSFRTSFFMVIIALSYSMIKNKK